ncbi:hypothetical protein ABZ924_13880 [Streptomyces sp. NPDC046876]|uniref:hypothetical protein n=1 Tax=Streptomyces sp. NPDC046876 TaxID=3155616 RepID=UPI0033CAC11D
MASIRTARVIAALAALPLAVALCAGTAQADNGAGAGTASNASVGEIFASGVAGCNAGNSATVQQAATGSGASNQGNGSQVNGADATVVGQGNGHGVFTFGPLP